MDEPLKNIVSPLVVFYSYAHSDERFQRKLATHLSNLKRQGFITEWHYRNISAGSEWEREISEYLDSAQIILLLVSPDFIDSDYCYSKEMMQAMKRHEAGEARVIPILLRPGEWKGVPFEKLQVLPTNAKPVTLWRNRDEAFTDVAKGIRRVIEEWQIRPEEVSSKTLIYREQRDISISVANIDSNGTSVSSIGHRQNEIASNDQQDPKAGFSLIHYLTEVWLRVLFAGFVILLFSVIITIAGLNKFGPPVFLAVINHYPMPTVLTVSFFMLISLFAWLFDRRMALQIKRGELIPHSLKNAFNLFSAVGISTINVFLCLFILFILSQSISCSVPPCDQSGLSQNNIQGDDLKIVIQTIQSPAYFIPNDPATYTLSNLPTGVGAQRIDYQSLSSYKVVLSIQNVHQNSYGITIDNVFLVVDQAELAPYEVKVWNREEKWIYPNNVYRVIYKGQTKGAKILADYVASPIGKVHLMPRETDSLVLEAMSQIMIDLHFQIMIQYHNDNSDKDQYLLLPKTFEVIFSKADNWFPYHLQDGHLVPGS